MARTPYRDPAEHSGVWNRAASNFRSSIPSERFTAERNRYILYINTVCPWCHRATIAVALKGLEDVIEVVEVDARDPVHGWYFSGSRGPDRDPVYGVRWLKELYLKADPEYSGRISIPVLWDRQEETIVNNESSDILNMLIHAFDPLLPENQREPHKGFSPTYLRREIDLFNAWIFDTVNNGVYKVGFATSQAAYNEHVTALFQSLDRLEHHLSRPEHRPYLFGEHITEADIRLFATLIRFDVAYYTLFKCNVKMIRVDYPRLHEWLRRLYWSEGPESGGGAFRKTTNFEVIKRGYASVTVGNGVVPAGPVPHILPL